MVLNKNVKSIIWYILILIIICLVCYRCGYNKREVKVEYKTITKIKKVIDTLKVEVNKKENQTDKITKKVNELKQKPYTYPKVCDTIVRYKDSIIKYQDTIILKKDSIIYIYKEIDLKKDEIIKIQKKYYPKRIGVGVQLGTTYIDNNFKPYVGIGISYNLFNF